MTEENSSWDPKKNFKSPQLLLATAAVEAASKRSFYVSLNNLPDRFLHTQIEMVIAGSLHVPVYIIHTTRWTDTYGVTI